MSKTHHHDTKPPTSPPRGLEPAPFSSIEEEQILKDVRQIVWQRYSQMPQYSEAKKTTSRSPMRVAPPFALWKLWPAAPIAALAIGLLLWSRPSAPPTEPLSLQGQARVGTNTPRQHTQTSLKQRLLEITTQQKIAKIQAAKRWKIQIEAHSALAVEQIHPQHHRLQLHQGSITVDVTPQQIKRFEIVLPHHHIHVKGTRFTVERSHRWWRVEMETGRIALLPAKSAQITAKQHTTSALFLQRGQGARVHTTTGQIETYPVPPSSHRLPSKRVAWWLSQNNPAPALRWLADHLERYPQEKVFYARSLQDIAEYYRAKKDIPRVLAILIEIHKRDIPNESELALPEALALCRTVATHPACIQVFQLSLQQKKPGPFAEHALFWLAVGLHQQKTTAPHKSTQLLLRYVQQFPNGEHIPRVLDMLRQQTSPHALCPLLAKHLNKHTQQPAWWNRVCAPR